MSSWWQKATKNDISKFAQSEQNISGPAVDNLISVAKDMYGRGAPIERNDWGFNGNHYSHPNMHQIISLAPGSPMAISLAVWGIRALNVYKNTQLVSEYPTLLQGIQDTIHQADPQPAVPDAPTIKQKPQAVDVKIVEHAGAGSYRNKEEFKIPVLSWPRGKVAQAIKRAIRTKMETMNDRFFSMQYNQYSQRDEWPVYKAISQSKAKLDHYEIDTKFLGEVSTILQADGYDVSAMQMGGEDAGAGEVAEEQGKPMFEGAILNGQRTELKLNFPRSRNLMTYVNAVKALPYNMRQYDRGSYTWTVFGPTSDWVTQFADVLSDEFNVQKLLEIAAQLKANPAAAQPDSSLKSLEATNITGEGRHMQVAIKSTRDRAANEQLKEMIRYIFPVYDENGMRNYNRNVYRWEFNGKLSQYKTLIRVANIHGFDTSILSAVVDEISQLTGFVNDKVPGELDGFQQDGKNDTEKFNQALDVYKFPLYDKQKEGVQFLYSNQSAILGDETGAGKTIQMVGAADQRMKQSGGRTLIITLNATQLQWMKEIEKFTGDKDISADPSDGKKWTVLNYYAFSDPHKNDAGLPRRDELVQTIIDQNNFQVLILDESHTVKNESKRTENIAKIAENIPFKWGATATVIANKAIDAYRQAQILNHPLGDVSKGRFKRDFAGMVPEGYGGAYVPGTPEQQREAASHLRKQLVQTGFYLKRTKKDMNPDMPNHTVEEVPVELDTRKLSNAVGRRMKSYKDRELPISQLIAERTEVASAKVPFTLDLAKNVLTQGKKVIVFTCFIDSAEKLVAGLEKIVAGRDVGGGTVVGVYGNRDTASNVENFKNPNGDAKALVLSILKGGTGLDLPNIVDDVIINDFSWTPKDKEQSEGRAFRISSTNDVNTRYVIGTNSVDQDMYDYVKEKTEIARLIQDLENKENELVMQGADVSQLLKERAELEQRSAKLDNKPVTGIAGKALDRQAKGMSILKTGIGVNWYTDFKISSLQ